MSTVANQSGSGIREEGTMVCLHCDGKGYVAIQWVEHDPRRANLCWRCGGTGEACREVPDV